MRCTSPRTVGFKSDGKTLAWSQKDYSQEYATFQLPCGKCLECRLEYARQWAVRCVHEAQMHEKNCFVTLTYDDEHLESARLDYSHFQKFMKKIRKTQNEPIGFFVTGEYGETNKRPHWHAIIFNWEPRDLTYKRVNERGDKIFSSKTLEKYWGRGGCESGSVTFDSAGYCARYSAKKLVHGKDADHDFHPISKKSSRNAIGKKWLERFYPDVFNLGRVVLRDGTEMAIPRYYEKWLKEHKPDDWLRFTLGAKQKNMEVAQQKNEQQQKEWTENLNRRLDEGKRFPLTPNEVKKKIQEQKFNELQKHLKL